MNLYLIGYRATGKTTVGRRLAAKLGRRFVDADEYLESTVKMTVAQIVARCGWEDFRKRETEVITRLSDQKDIVVATGGGVVLDPENIRMLKNTGQVVWLHADADTIISRMKQDRKTKTLRPRLSDEIASPDDEVKQILAQRMPLYQQASHTTVNTDNKSVEEISDQILKYLSEEAFSISPNPNCHS